VEGGSLLDVGCGLGDFVTIAKNNGWDVTATELSKYAADYVLKAAGIDVIHGEISNVDFGFKKFNVITMWRVLEHMDDPLKALKIVHHLLKEDGLLVVEVPNAYYLVQLLKNYLKTRNFFSSFILDGSPEPHLVHFSVESLKKLLADTGFRIKNIYVGIYGEHQSGILRRLKSKIYNISTILVYLLSRKNIGVNTRIYAVKVSECKIA
jgi:2-polyprenyl-3-methyl-5-hydroxy-6-metoxy-1,4-benzoquinol methylase